MLWRKIFQVPTEIECLQIDKSSGKISWTTCWKVQYCHKWSSSRIWRCTSRKEQVCIHDKKNLWQRAGCSKWHNIPKDYEINHTYQANHQPTGSVVETACSLVAIMAALLSHKTLLVVIGKRWLGRDVRWIPRFDIGTGLFQLIPRGQQTDRKLLTLWGIGWALLIDSKRPNKKSDMLLRHKISGTTIGRKKR